MEMWSIEVKYGQTLWSIAIEYGTTIEQIKRLNNLTDDTVIQGWKLLVKKGATQPVPSTSALSTERSHFTEDLHSQPRGDANTGPGRRHAIIQRRGFSQAQ